MEDRIWYSIPNNGPFPVSNKVIKVTNEDPNLYINEIKQSIDLFNKEVNWDNMWDLEEAGKRFSSGQILFLFRDNKGPLGHVWFDEDYLHNIFVSSRREPGESVKLLQHCLNHIQHKEIQLYCDSWNKKAQSFFKKVGAKEISSYL